jgi:predicted NUDIX family NTP pyrophosphohydrolase
MAALSAGLLPVRCVGDRLEFFLVHPGGPFFRNKDDGAWSLPKGLVADGEDPLRAAQREFVEETACALPAGTYHSLGRVRQSNKWVEAWAVLASIDPESLRSNTFEMEWPPRSGKLTAFPEIDRAGWFERAQAERKILAAQQPFLERAEQLRDAFFEEARSG